LLSLQVRQLTCVRGQKILSRNIHFELSSGDLLLIEGRNGSGKTSLLRQLAALSTTETGRILWRGQDIHTCYPHYWQHLHYLGHSHGIKLGLTIEENLKLMASLAEMPISLSCQDAILQQLNLHTYQHTLAADLSAGQKRRLALARLWLIHKPLWILDEPLTALDRDSQALFLHHLDQHLTTGGMCILSSHSSLPVVPLVILRLPQW